tara:strand:- start:556 stop:855 length:300 start_codon:yes stop_codon:yes gene_type:complete
MPYIDQNVTRILLDDDIDRLINKIRDEIDVEDREGVLNYTLTRVLCESLPPHAGWRYKYMNRAMGVLECMKQEIYRRLIGPYEDKAIDKNGDLECLCAK